MNVTDLPWLPARHDLDACNNFPEIRNAWHDSKPGEPAHYAVRLICAGCPVRLQCALSALERGEPWEIWSGLNRAEPKTVALEFGYPVPTMMPDDGTLARYVKHGRGCPDCRPGPEQLLLPGLPPCRSATPIDDTTSAPPRLAVAA
ncbi:WhiB family transcriptional regulator [Amycolatopsis anabasis]|uniref:WhiB family transcriptional regulator n=1 Tax=Amycolatopsis anabasis TaxID=1840409 RepID=UPI001C552AFD|nr:WhiB family transcriptional regulator [Amycolatopsis anabasis]